MFNAMSHGLFKASATVLLIFLTCTAMSCGTSLKLRHDDERFSESPLPWENLMEDGTNAFEPSPEFPMEPSFPPEAIAKLAPHLGGNHELAEIALRRSVRNPVVLDGGVYGKVGTATFYAVPRSRIATYDRLYWSMMKVLSEKYGCFVKNKVVEGSTLRFYCRDKRSVVLWRAQNEQFLQFYGRQYDKLGRELIVDKHKVVARR